MDAGAIKKMFGEEGYNTASVILQNTEMVKDFTAAVTGTNVAYEQAAINSDTAQAKLEQARNKMKLAAIDLGEKLNPALTVSTNMLTNVLKYLPGLIDWCKNGVVPSYMWHLVSLFTHYGRKLPLSLQRLGTPSPRQLPHYSLPTVLLSILFQVIPLLLLPSFAG